MCPKEELEDTHCSCRGPEFSTPSPHIKHLMATYSSSPNGSDAPSDLRYLYAHVLYTNTYKTTNF